MKRIVLSLATILFMGALSVGATGAFFNDTETSAGNVFTTGAIVLTVDSTQHYDGNVCSNVGTDNAPVYEWEGNSVFPVPGTACNGTWTPTALGPTNQFFNFPDVKPGDQGEDTISMHLENNPAWACMDITANNNAENGVTAPEIASADNPALDGQFDGELDQNLSVFAWIDDGSSTSQSIGVGDNVYEPSLGEKPLFGPNYVSDLFGGSITGTTTITIPLADSTTGSGPLPAGSTSHIGWSWCVGSTTVDNVTGAITCDGSSVNNNSQTDSFGANVTLSVTQARNLPTYTCGTSTTGNGGTAQLTVTKVVVNDNGGNKTPADFALYVFNDSTSSQITTGVPRIFPAGSYDVTEAGSSGYQATYSGDCDSEGNITLNSGDVKSCTITNTELPAHITLIKSVTGSGLLLPPSVFTMRVNGIKVPSGSSIAVKSNTPNTITEDAFPGYTFVGPITGSPECPAVLGGTATLSEGEAITCVITNNKNPI